MYLRPTRRSSLDVTEHLGANREATVVHPFVDRTDFGASKTDSLFTSSRADEKCACQALNVFRYGLHL